MNPKLKYIGKNITIKSIRNFILDNDLTAKKIILLNSTDFDNIVLEHLDLYQESMQMPYYLLEILITEDNTRKVPFNRIGIINHDEIENQDFTYEETFDLYDGEKAYRCGFCGNIVDQNGNELDDEDRERIIKYIENFDNPTINHTFGKCCKKQY